MLPMAPTNQKSLPDPTYSVGTNPNAHVRVFMKAIQNNGERNDLNIVKLFCFTLKDVISKWGKIFIYSHPKCTFAKLEVAFGKRYRKMQIKKHEYMALRVIKQAMNEKVEVYYECILRLANCLNHKADNNLLTTFF